MTRFVNSHGKVLAYSTEPRTKNVHQRWNSMGPDEQKKHGTDWHQGLLDKLTGETQQSGGAKHPATTHLQAAGQSVQKMRAAIERRKAARVELDAAYEAENDAVSEANDHLSSAERALRGEK
jgi:hypothetical protein